MSKGKFLWLIVLQLFLPFDVLETDEYRSFFNFIFLSQATGTCEMPNRAPCRKEHDAKILTDYAIEAAFGYSVFVTQHTASSNCFFCKRCSFGDILCLALDSFLIFGLLILQKVKTAHKTLTSPSATLRTLSTVGFLILTLSDQYSSSAI